MYKQQLNDNKSVDHGQVKLQVVPAKNKSVNDAAKTLNAVAIFNSVKQQQSSKMKGWSYLEEGAKAPQSTDKDDSIVLAAQLSGYKTKEAVLSHDLMSLAWADIDTGGYLLNDVADILTSLGVESAIIYSTASSNRLNKDGELNGNRWRVLIELAKPICCEEWLLIQEALVELMHGDSSAMRVQQILYAPNNPETSDPRETRHYEYRILKGSPINPDALPEVIASTINRLKSENEAAHQITIKAIEARPVNTNGGGFTFADANQSLDTRQSMEAYGYQKYGRKWKSVNSASNKPGVHVFSDGRWYSHHSSDVDLGIGLQVDGGCCGDAFDLYCFYEHKNDVGKAISVLANECDPDGQKQRQREYMLRKSEVAAESKTAKKKSECKQKRKEGEEKLKIAKEIERINKLYSLVVIGGTAKVIYLNSSKEYDLLSINAFQSLLGNEFLDIGTEDKPKFATLSRVWLSNAGRRTYCEGVEFTPTKDALTKSNPNKLNLWTGFAYTPKKHDINKIKPITEYIFNIVCDGNKEYFNYLIRWIARGFQCPEKHAEVAVVLRGTKGSGKGTLGKLLKKMWGVHGKHIASSKYLTGNFNGHLKNCCFMFADEAFFAGDHAGEANLKALITEPTMTIEFKGVDAIETANRLKILIASNKDWVIPSSKDERRFFCLDVEEKFTDIKEKSEYFSLLYKAINDDSIVSMFMDYLQAIDLSNFDFRSYPETEANKNQRIQSLGVIPRFLLDACDREYLLKEIMEKSIWHERVTSELVIEGLNEWGRSNFKSNYERPKAYAVKQYLNKSLSLKSKAYRNIAYYFKGGAVVSPTQRQGYELGSPDELKSRIIEYERLPEM